MGLGLRRRSRSSYDDVEGLTISLGVFFAILLPACMELQNQGFDEGVQSKNFLLLICTQSRFRSFVVETLSTIPLEDEEDGASPEMFDFNLSLGGARVLDTKALLQQDSSIWKWDDTSSESIYPCGTNSEIATANRALHEAFPLWRMDFWVLMNPKVALWTDHLSAMSAFAMSVMVACLGGSLAIYISLILSSAKEDESGVALGKWIKVGYPLLACSLMLLMGGTIVMLFANDAFSESQDPFFLRNGRWAGYSKLALLCVFTPVLVLFIIASIWSLLRSCTGKRNRAGDRDARAANARGGRDSDKDTRWNV